MQATLMAHAALLAALAALCARPAAAYTAGAPSAAFAGAAAIAAEEAIERPMRPEAGTDVGPHDAVWPALAPRAHRGTGQAAFGPGAAPAPGAAPGRAFEPAFDAQALQATIMRANTPFFGPDIGVIPNRTESNYLTSIASLNALLAQLGGPAAEAAGAEAAANATSNVTVTDVASEHPPLQNTTLVVRLNEVANVLFTTAGLPPPVYARAVFIVHTCIYDTWAAYNDTAIGLYWPRDLRQRRGARREQEQAISYAAYRCLVYLLPAATSAANASLVALGYDPAAAYGSSGPANVAAAAAGGVIAARSNDGSNQANNYADTTGYVPTNTPYQIVNPNLWQPLSIYNAKLGANVTQKFTTPQWLNVTPFALTCGTQFLAPSADIYQYGSLGYVAQAQELLAISAELNDVTKTVVEYWADPTGSQTPPGHWTRICEYVSVRDNHTLGDDARMFFAVTGALLDASITSWAMKRVYTSVRPITAIHYLYSDIPVESWAGPYQGTKIILGGSWVPFQPPSTITPSFPSFTSAHSTFSAAATQVLRSFTGADYAGFNATVPPGASVVEPGATPSVPVTLAWATFRQMAIQAGYSRLLGGIHFHNDNIRGRQTGTAVGWQAWAKAQALFQGRQYPNATECTHADFVHDLPYPKDNLYDEGVIRAELQGLASTPTAAAPTAG